jgi:hypothetical protein
MSWNRRLRFSTAMSICCASCATSSPVIARKSPSPPSAQLTTDTITYQAESSFREPDRLGIVITALNSGGATSLNARFHATRDDGGLPHGLVGAVSGAIVGGGLGYFQMAIHCDNGVECKPARAILIGAAAGAVVGVVIEYFVRNGQR